MIIYSQKEKDLSKLIEYEQYLCEFYKGDKCYFIEPADFPRRYIAKQNNYIGIGSSYIEAIQNCLLSNIKI